MSRLPIRVSIVEDSRGYREHLVALINGADGFTCSGAHATAESAVKEAARENPDVLLLDLELPGLSGDACIMELRQKLPALEVLVITMHDEAQRIFKALEAGASGYLVKPVSPARVLEAIAEVRAGGSPMSSQIARLVVRFFHRRGERSKALDSLTPREEEILASVARGCHTKEIAGALNLQPSTVATHLHNIYEKLHVHSRAAAASAYLRHNTR